MARLRHTAIERHMGMGAEPLVTLLRKHHRRAAGARKRPAVFVIPGAGPRGDHDRHHTIGRRQNRSLLQHETEVCRLRPDIVPLRRNPLVQPGDDIVVRAEGEHLRVKERPRRGVVDVAHES